MSRAYTTDDLPAVQRIWKEVGWVDDDSEAAHIEHFFAEGDVRLAEIGGEVACSVSTHSGTFRYKETDLPAQLVSSVTTSWIGRKQGFAQQLTAEALAAGAESGAAISLLGMFEQGFYNRLGFGSGPYEYIARFDPGMLRVDAGFRPPIRFSAGDYSEVAAALRSRRLSHGGFTLDSDQYVRAELGWSSKLALGYRDDSGRLTHFMTGETKGESGPYSIGFFSYESTDQLMELLALLQGLGDQVRSVSLAEPPEVQIQDLLAHPNRHKIITKGTDFEVGIRATAWWQARMLDVGACVAARHWDGPPVRFNLRLHDPVVDVANTDWPGVGGTYVVEIGEESSAVPGEAAGVPTLRSTINAFTRMWMGARSATSLALTEEFDGPASLLADLDHALRLPTPRPGMFF